jgi:DNA-binding CsgD family transcriptional regulator
MRAGKLRSLSGIAVTPMEPAYRRLVIAFILSFFFFGSRAQTPTIDSLRNELAINNATNRIPLLLSISQQFLNINIDTSFTYAKRALTVAEQSRQADAFGKIYSHLGRIRLVSGPFEDALDYLLKAEDYLKGREPVDKMELIRVYANLGAVYERLDDLDKSQPYFELSIGMLDEYDRETGAPSPSPIHAPLYNNFANTLIKKGDTTKAIIYQKKGLEYAMTAKDYLQAASLLNNIGKVHLERNEPELGYPYLKQGASLRKQANDNRGLSASYRNLAFYFLTIRSLDSAKFYIHESIRLYEEIGDMNEPLSGVYFLLSNIYIADKKYDSALFAYKVHISYEDSVYGGPKFKELARVEAKYEMLRKAQQEQEVQKEKELKNFIIIAGLVIGLLTISLLFLFQRYRSKTQRLQFEQLKLREEKLMVEQNGLQIDLEYKRKDLATQMLFLLKKDEFIHKISQRISTVKEEVPAEVQPKLLKITRELQNISKSNDSSWREFELRFKEVHQDFYEKLEAQYPDLTPKERRLCALLKLNMTTKEISSITHQSTRSLEVARTRLRRKFHLTNSEVGLVDFLAKI